MDILKPDIDFVSTNLMSFMKTSLRILARSLPLGVIDVTEVYLVM